MGKKILFTNYVVYSLENSREFRKNLLELVHDFIWSLEAKIKVKDLVICVATAEVQELFKNIIYTNMRK